MVVLEIDCVVEIEELVVVELVLVDFVVEELVEVDVEVLELVVVLEVEVD